jgi:hypothetical protein
LLACANMEDDRVKCHFCEKSYIYTGSLKSHESNVNHVKIEKEKTRSKPIQTDQLYDYILMLFKLVMLHRKHTISLTFSQKWHLTRSFSILAVQ